jgi:hypothetical protein
MKVFSLHKLRGSGPSPNSLWISPFTVTVGGDNADYINLRAVFNAINSGILTGNISS